MEIGSTVRQAVKPIEGVIVDTNYNKTDKRLEHLVEYVDEDGQTHARWFTEADLEVVS